MERKNLPKESLSVQVKSKIEAPPEKRKEYDGNTNLMISTGSTLLDLAICGGRVRGGGIPGGILVEVFGPSSAGKTVLLCEIAGAIQRQGGKVMFHDPEARLNKQFAQLFGLNTKEMGYDNPDTVTELFSKIRKWEVDLGKNNTVNGIFADSLAALSTDLEMESEEGDKMGMRRAKEFSEGLRKVCRLLTRSNYLMVCSNQIRESGDSYGPKYKSPGGMAIGFYSSLRLKAGTPEKIFGKATVAGKEIKRAIGVETEFEVFKSTVWKPYRTAPLYILFDYGIDDVRANLQYLKTYTKATTYVLGDMKLSQSMDESIALIESSNLEGKLRETVIDLWESIEKQFETERKPKQR